MEGLSRRKAHEASPEFRPCEQTVLSCGTVSLCGVSERVTAGSDVVGAHSSHTGRSHQTGACRLPLPRPPMCGTSPHLSQCEGRCAGLTVVHLWNGYCAAGGTVATERAPDRG